MQEQAYKQLIKILDNNNLKDSAKALQKELQANSEQVQSFSRNNDQALSNQSLPSLEAINKVLKQKDTQDKHNRQPIPPPNKRIQSRKQVSAQENEQIMDSLISRLVKNQALLEDEKLNAKIEKFFDNQTFQKMVENVDVLQEMSSAQKEAEEVPQFGSKVQIEEASFNQPKEFSLQQFQQPQPALDSDLRSPSFGDNQVAPQSSSVRKNSKNQKVPKYESPEQRVKSSQKSSNLKQEEMPSLIQANEQESSYFFQDSQSFLLKNLEENQQKSTMNRIKEQIKQIQSNTADEYTNDDDPGYDLYEVDHSLFSQLCKQLAEKYNYPQRIVKKYNTKLQQFVQEALEEQEDKNKKKKDGKQKGLLPSHIKFPQEVAGYPLHYDGIIYDGFHLRVVFDRERTGFEESKDFPIVINQIIAGRYEIVEYLGSAAFSKAIGCRDLFNNKKVCMKIIENNKDYLDQSIDEIKLLKYINSNTEEVDTQHVLKLYDYFYYKEHLFIVTEQLKENLYEYQKLYKETNNNQNYFTIGKLQKITKQILRALEYLNGLKLIHCDLKPENILIKSYSKCEVKLIDFGSSCFIHDHLSSYVQSRSYRAPEVILGCKYDYRIDIWSLGCILAELYTGQVIFQNESIAGLLARVVGIIGPIPERMFNESRLKNNYFTSEKLIYQDANGNPEQSHSEIQGQEGTQTSRVGSGKVQVLVAKKSSLKHRLRTDDPLFLDFVTKCLEIDPLLRFSASEALLHPWLTNIKYKEGLA